MDAAGSIRFTPSFCRHFVPLCHLAENVSLRQRSLPPAALILRSRPFLDSRSPGVNPLLEAAKIYGVMGLAFALSSLALCLRRFSGSSVKMFGFGLQQALLWPH